jgi:DNA polymerase I
MENYFSLDTETTSLKYTELKLEGISLSDSKSSCYIYLANFKNNYSDHENNNYYINPEYNDLIDTLRVFLLDKKNIVMHNSVYDMKVLYKYGIFLEKAEIFDTLIADHLLDENKPHGLKGLAKEYLDADTEDYTEIENHSSQRFFEYAMNDAIWTYQIMELLAPRLKEEGLEKLFREIEMPFMFVLRDMEINGMLVNKDMIRLKRERVQNEIYRLRTSLYQISGVTEDFNFNSSKQLGELLFTKMELPILETTPSGKPATGTSVLEKLSKSSDFCKTLLQYKEYQKILTSYLGEDSQILKNIDEDGRVRPNFLDFGTVTGRLSCQSPNLQQLPKSQDTKPELDIRECFIAPSGKKLLTCDYSGQELRVLAEITKDESLIDTFQKGKDMHLSTANDFFNLGIPEEALYENNPRFEEYKKKFKTFRNQAKTINFGIAYGKGAYGFSQDFGSTEQEAQEILDKYFASKPKVKESIERCYSQVKSQGYVTSMTGRRRRFKMEMSRYGTRYYSNSSLRQSFNFLIQGFSADMIRMALIGVQKLIREHPEYELKIIATVHDEGVFEVKEEFTDIVALQVKNIFKKVVTFCVPIESEIGVGSNYSEAK